jgi:hypothetical protein
MEAFKEIQKTIRLLRKLWPASQKQQLDHYEEAVSSARITWQTRPSDGGEPAPVNFTPQNPEAGK